MYFRSLWAATRGVAGVSAVLCLLVSGGVAQAACYGPQQQLPAQTISTFLGNPAQLLQQYPTGGAQLISQIRDLAASDPATLQPILQLLANANKDQKTAIGSGLGQAARVCVRTDQAYATQIQYAIAKTKDEDVWLAYTSITGDVQLGGVGGGAGSAGAVGGQTNPLPGGPTGSGAVLGIPGGSAGTGAFNFTSSVGGTGGTSTSNTTTTNTTNVTTPVSQ